jgi:SpoVK/Ycf46/Vps4 family AAA+-type ATPase
MKRSFVLSIILVIPIYCTETQSLADRNAQLNKALEGTEYYDVSSDLLKGARLAAELSTIPHEWGHFDCYSFQSPMSLNMDFFIIQESLSTCPELLKNDLENLVYARDNGIPHNHYLYRNPINQILLTGPAASGKTSLSLAIASKTGRDFILLPAGSLSKGFMHSPLSILNNLFFTALLPEQPRIIIFDEIPALTDVTSAEYDPVLVKHFCSYLDQSRINPNLIIIVIAQNNDLIPLSIKDRFSVATFSMPELTAQRRYSILKHYLCEPCKMDQKLLRDLVIETEGFDLRKLSLFIKQTLNIEFSRTLEKSPNNKTLVKNDLLSSLQIFKTMKYKKPTTQADTSWNIKSITKKSILPILAFVAGFYLKTYCS